MNVLNSVDPANPVHHGVAVQDGVPVDAVNAVGCIIGVLP